MKNKTVDKSVSEYMAKIGSKGGAANSSKAQSERSKSAWSKYTAKQRSEIMKQRAAIRAKKAK